MRRSGVGAGANIPRVSGRGKLCIFSLFCRDGIEGHVVSCVFDDELPFGQQVVLYFSCFNATGDFLVQCVLLSCCCVLSFDIRKHHSNAG